MKTIAVDIDDTLADFATAVTQFSNERWGCNLRPGDYSENWASMWQVDPTERDRRGDIVERSGIQATLTHDEDAVRVLSELKKEYRLIVLSARPAILQPVSIEWINRHYPGIFEDIQFADMWNNRSQLHLAHLETKATTCEKLGVDYLIDDQVKHCIGAAGKGIQSILFGNYAWNNVDELPDNVIRARTWNDIHDHFRKIGSRA